MKQLNIALLISFMLLLSSCAAVAGIFKAGVWTGVILIVFVVAIIIFLVTKSKKN